MDRPLPSHSHSLYAEFCAEREEILKHKWIESEKNGEDIGFERALIDWLDHHRQNWRSCRPPLDPGAPTPGSPEGPGAG